MTAWRTGGVLALVCLLWAPATATAQVEGRVVDPAGAIDSMEVTLEVHDGQQIVYSAAATAGSSGVVTFPEAPSGEGFLARLRGTANGAEYVSPTVSLGPDGEPLELVLTPVVTEGRPLHLDTLHLIVQSDEPSVLRVLQFMTVSNAAEAPFAGGPVLDDGRRAGLVVPLPLEATNVRPAPFPTAEAALDESAAQFGTDRILDARPVPASGRQVAVTYELPVGDDGIATELLLPYPTAAVSLMLGGAAREVLEVTSSTLVPGESDVIGDEQYDIWNASALSPGTALDVRFAPPGLRLDLRQVGVLSVGLGLLLAVAGSLVSTRRPAQVRRDRSAIIAAIASLDDAYEAGSIGAGAYFRQRGQELERLALLEPGQDTRDGS